MVLRRQLLLVATTLATAVAQPYITTLIRSRPELSNLTAYLDNHPDLVQSILRWPSGTFLAPSDEAFAKATHINDVFQESLNLANLNFTDIPALFSYHTVDYVIKSSDFLNGPHIVPTTLVDPTYTALSGGQVFMGNAVEGQRPVLTSGVESTSKIVVSVRLAPTLPPLPGVLMPYRT